ncbi:hypothetical protein [Mesobacillus foraminis]|uniref:hypothetical protein n=1 Tax=Mesobacillus foraminis TaxID=279826 RepID=UPI001304DA32|nr:hypothetical protein [Mesobacillus foraminis]
MVFGDRDTVTAVGIVVLDDFVVPDWTGHGGHISLTLAFQDVGTCRDAGMLTPTL